MRGRERLVGMEERPDGGRGERGWNEEGEGGGENNLLVVRKYSYENKLKRNGPHHKI